MNDKELMSFAIARSNDPIIKNPVLRDAMNKDLGPRIKVAERDNMNTPDLEQSPDSFLRPGETLKDFDVKFRRPNSDGGKVDEVIGAYKKYLGMRKGKQRYKVIPFTTFFEEFARENFADGGRMEYKNGKLVIQSPKMTKEKQKISSSPLKEDYLGQLKDKRKVRTSSLDDAFEIRNIIVKNKGHISNIEDLGKKAGIFVGGKSGKVDPRKTKLALDLALDSFDELKGFKLAIDKYPNIDKSGRKFRYLEMVAKSFANHNTTKNSLEAAGHLLQDNMAMIVDMGGKETFEKGFFNLKGKITNADKKFISERVASLTGKDFNIDSVNELIEETSRVRRSEGSTASKLKRYAKQNADIKNLYNDSTIQKLIKGDLNNKTRQKILNRAVDIVGDDVAIASRRLFMMAESMAGTRPIEGIVENKNLGNKLIDTQRIIGKKVKDGRAFSSLVYSHYAKVIDNALNSPKGKSFIGYYQQRIRNALDKGLVPDEIFSVTASARRGMSPYAIFTQALDEDVNSSIKGANLDGLLSKTHRDLQNIFQGRKYNQLNTKQKEAVQDAVGTFENRKKDVLKNLKPEVRDTIQLAEFDLKNPPSKSVANYDSYDKNLQKAFDKSFKDTGYSMKVTKDMKTNAQLLNELENLNEAEKTRLASMGGPDCKGNFAPGGPVPNKIRCITKALDRLKNPENLGPGDKLNAKKLFQSAGAKKFGNFLRGFGIPGEILFESVFAIPNYLRGESGKRILGDTLLGFIGAGQSAEEEFDEYAKKKGLSDSTIELIRDVNRLVDLGSSITKKETIGKTSMYSPTELYNLKLPRGMRNVYKAEVDETNSIFDKRTMDQPQAKQQFNENMFSNAMQLGLDVENDIQAARDKRKKRRQEMGIIADENYGSFNQVPTGIMGAYKKYYE